ncbi:efflux transporter outer membrane subunit [Carboxylicivirga mesophila]|uniref:Efflux transporter outer membrane subunit n=1 Tax=Carboxylicivirga mesophila TaxID=1166478 RepID=A0ABS5KG51_9BACT|nr:efflux transporter outer membrane subunit [Carboxylicivirga mesophila]MBS2213303.1 efflux transporter outer membrane subunit [Carboxylicivirga mesophila]
MKNNKLFYTMQQKAVVLLLIGLIALVSSCKVGKKYVKPELNLPDKLEVMSIDSTTIDDLQWWELYTDTVLQQLVYEALENNKDVLIASARLKQYMAAKRIASADLFPHLGADFHAEREMENYGGNNESASTELEVRASLTWEIDLWGNIRWGREAAIADYLATEEAQRALQMSIVAEVAETYFVLSALYDELNIVQQTLQARQEGVRLADLRFRGGLTSETSVQQAEVELAKTMTLVPVLERKIRISKNNMALLLGTYESEWVRGKGLDEQYIPDELPAGLPSELLERRPDIRAAEQSVVAANAMVGVATTNRFPSLSLTGRFGRENDELGEFLKSPYWFIAGDVLAPIFQAGKLKARQKESEARLEQEIYAYQRSVLQAFQEANTAIMTFRKAKEVYDAQSNLEEATRKYQKLAELQYLNGVINYLDLLDAQRSLFDAEIKRNNARRDELLSMVYLYKALGGGWKL